SVYFVARGSDANSDLFAADRSTAAVRFLKHTWNGAIRGLAKSGGRLFLAGDFIYVVDDSGFQQRPGVAALDPATGATLTDWSPGSDAEGQHSVYAIAADEST